MRTPLIGRVPARSRFLLSGLVAVGIVGMALAGTGATAAVADAPAQTTFVQEGFTGTTAGTSYILPSTQSGDANYACLTAKGAANTGSIPTCADASDAPGSGALRLTPAEKDSAGGVGAVQSVPITKGIDAVFNSYQYNGDAADGIVFYLAATDPYNPSVPAKIGYLGGSLGYSASTTNNAQGLSHAYLGIGLDRYGNFANRQFGGSGCDTDQGTNGTLVKNAVTVRGPGNGSVGYCVQSTTTVNGTLSTTGVTDRAAANVPVEIVINPTASALPAQQNPAVSVAAGHYAVIFTSIGGKQQVVDGTLPKLASNNAASIDPSWIDPATQYPYKLTYGWVAGTGGQKDVHEVNYLKTTTAAGPVPALSAVTGGSSSVAHAGNGTYTVTPTVSADGGSESQPIRTTTTFPANVTPQVPGGTNVGTNWSCTVAGQVATCDYTPTSTIAAGTVLPTLTIPYSVSGAARTATVSTVVASTDAEAVTVTGAVVVDKQKTAIATSDVTATVGTTAKLTATVSSTEKTGSTVPGGTVEFRSADASNTLLCSVTLVNGAASCSVPASAVGTSGFVVSYAGDTDHAAAANATAALVVTKIATAVSLSASPSPSTYGSPATLTASGLPSGATGTVEFREGDTVLCTATLPATSCDAPAGLAAGTHTLTAVYSGDTTHDGATAADVSLTVQKATASIGAGGGTGSGTGSGGDGSGSGGSGSGGSGSDEGGAGGSDPDTTVTVTHGQSTTLDTPNVPEDATGTIEYRTGDGTVLCTATLPATTCVIPDDLAGGKYTVQAYYLGDDNYEPSQGDPFDLVVAAQPTELVADTETSTATVGSKVRLKASGIPEGATGTITFTNADGDTLCTATLPETSCETDALPVGSNEITVTYDGDDSFATSSTTLSVDVTKRPTELAAPTAPTSAVVGSKVRLTATGLPEGATGTVTFTDADGKVLCTATLPETSCETDALPVGSNTVTVSYSGDATFAASSTTLEVVITAAPAGDEDPTPAPTVDPTTAPTATATPAATAGTELAFTGAPIVMSTGIALALALLVGGLVLLVARRRAARDTESTQE
ncbi:Ig-like domain-containing protein [Curtobacterium sp. PhB130]|uniref:Ig-like domain repeat protein n=1 Tax=Curtobacterium sp. PhB130 TaxID=2485178 RepID=UPI000F9E468E|nr:Ig-like domain repeat protein [Curtobacterium sp. PhB130]ROS78210.1 Ig-like domain-containing protein [Curtobacterium sp. PhB130]